MKIKIITGINKWEAEGKTFGTQADAETYAANLVESRAVDEVFVKAVVCKFALPPVRAVKMDV